MLTGLPAWGESVLHEEYLGYLVEHFGESPKKPQGIDFFCYDFMEKCFMKDPSKRWTADMLLGPDGYAIGFLGSGRLLLLDSFAEKELDSGGIRK
ncbi:MAP kinase kinase kinase [Arachis hypogaea]|nr:MAP kinase kinase kinase [Arachis hypogaea]